MSDWSQIRDEIKARLRLSDIVGRKVMWDRRKSQPSRGEFWACCPFHNEKSPSFHVLDREGYYKCFGCGAGGDAVEFVMQTENRSYREAMEMLAEEAGVELPKPSAYEREQAQKRATLHEVLEKACVFFEESLRLSGGEVARAYLKKRGLPADVVKEFRLGYAPDGGHALIDYLKSHGVEIAQMRAGGLLAKAEDEARDLMRHRLIFPISDGRGRVIAFGGRALRNEQQPKYLNSPDTELFHKGRTLYNFAKARGRVASQPNRPSLDGGGTTPAASGKGGAARMAPVHTPPPNPLPQGEGGLKRRAAPLIVAEGYMDVIALCRAGFRAVAPLGTALTEDQLQLLWSVEEAPVICFDGDDAGLAAAGRALDRALPLLQPGRTLRFAFLPPGEDPDDLLKSEGVEGVQRVIVSARPLADTYWDFTVRRSDVSTPDGRARAEAELNEGLRRIADYSVRRHYEAFIRGKVSEWFARAPRRDFREGGFAPRRKPAEKFPAPKPRPSAELLVRRGRINHVSRSEEKTEATIVLSMLTHPEVVHDLVEELGALHLSPPYDALCAAIIREVERGAVDSEALLAKLDVQGLASDARRLISRQGLRCEPSAHLASERTVVIAGLRELIAGLAARAEAHEARRELQSALGQGLTDEAWAEARRLHQAAQRQGGAKT
ncbi:MAG: CHC2 zinc finger domain-containing protein [Alphaproteobacteria bacterium]